MRKTTSRPLKTQNRSKKYNFSSSDSIHRLSPAHEFPVRTCWHFKHFHRTQNSTETPALYGDSAPPLLWTLTQGLSTNSGVSHSTRRGSGCLLPDQKESVPFFCVHEALHCRHERRIELIARPEKVTENAFLRTICIVHSGQL